MVTFRLQFPRYCRILIFDDMALFRMPQKYATDDSIVYIDRIRKEVEKLIGAGTTKAFRLLRELAIRKTGNAGKWKTKLLCVNNQQIAGTDMIV